MTYTTIAARPEIPAGPPKLTPRQLSSVQAETLDAPRLRYSLLARALFTTMDLAYGRTRTIVKFAMLEFIARVPYQAWERMGYLTLARYRGRSALARRVFERIVESRADQDTPAAPADPARSRAAPRPAAVVPAPAPAGAAAWGRARSSTTCPGCSSWSARSGATGSTRTSRTTPSTSTWPTSPSSLWRLSPTPAPTWNTTASTGAWPTVLRQIGHDERTHKQGSLTNMRAPRLQDPHPAA